MEIYVNDETSPLRAVVLGSARNFGGTPSLDEAYDPKTKEHILAGTFPVEDDLIREMDGFRDVLERHGIKVYRPEVLGQYNQIFSRDIGFVIEDKFIKPRILKNRTKEIEGIQYIIDQIPAEQMVYVPDGARMEGGDVMPWKDHIFVGYSKKEDFEEYVVARTNEEGLDFLRSAFPNKQVVGFELNKSDDNPRENALHLDCCFQPIGTSMGIIYPGGFKNRKEYEYLVDYFGKDNLIEITQEEMYLMNSNVFSISPEVIVSEISFTRLNQELRARGFTVEAIPYSETAKMEGLLRCSTLPLLRENSSHE
jgi:N-dimethylarginine dimethylaminohydrolase